jgi:predicted dithiol-disulfide oxidoreductase (DUF899 family)
MPMVRLDKDYRFTAPDGTTVELAGLFQGRRQLVIYHFMLEPGQDCTARTRAAISSSSLRDARRCPEWRRNGSPT